MDLNDSRQWGGREHSKNDPNRILTERSSERVVTRTILRLN